jgi:hypothetical protein
MSTSTTQTNLTLNAKQQTVLLVLWPCLKAPPRIDVQIGPEGIRLGATFDRTAPGMVCGTVRSEHNQIAIAANLDVATVEVDFERLKAAAGLASAEEAMHVWESIKDVVSAAAAAVTPASHRSRNNLRAGERWEVPGRVSERRNLTVQFRLRSGLSAAGWSVWRLERNHEPFQCLRNCADLNLHSLGRSSCNTAGAAIHCRPRHSAFGVQS